MQIFRDPILGTVVQKDLPAGHMTMVRVLMEEQIRGIPHIYSIEMLSPKASFLSLMEEHLGDVSLQDVLDAHRLKRSEKAALLDGLLSTLEKLHRLGIFHPNLNPDHLMVRDGRLYITCLDDALYLSEEKQPQKTDEEALSKAGQTEKIEKTASKADLQSCLAAEPVNPSESISEHANTVRTHTIQDLHAVAELLIKTDPFRFARIIRKARKAGGKDGYASLQEMRDDLQKSADRLLL